MRKYEEMCEAILTKGVLKAFGKMTQTPKAECECGFCLPQYAGRYPKCCPICGETLKMIGPNGNLAQHQISREEQNGGELEEVPEESEEFEADGFDLAIVNKDVEEIEKQNKSIEPLQGSTY